MNDLPKRLRIVASMIALGERIAWGSDTALMEEAADVIEALSASVENHQLRAKLYEQQQASRCSDCGYLTSHREHLGCLRKAVAELDAATGGQPQALETARAAISAKSNNGGVVQ